MPENFGAVVKALQAKRAAIVRDQAGLAAELEKVDGALSALRGVGAATARGRKAGRKKGGTWKPGSRGRPPAWYTAKMKAKGAKKAPKRKAAKRKRKVSAAQLEGLAKARAVVLANRRKAKAAGAG